MVVTLIIGAGLLVGVAQEHEKPDLAARLASRVESGDDAAARNAIRGLLGNEIRSLRATNALLRIVESDRHGSLRRWAVEAVPRVCPEGADEARKRVTETLTRLVATESDLEIRAEAAASLGQTAPRNQQVVTRLLRLSDTSDPALRAGCYRGLGYIRTSRQQVVNRLVRGLEDKARVPVGVSANFSIERPVTDLVLRALAKQGRYANTASQEVSALLNARDRQTVSCAAAALAAISITQSFQDMAERRLCSFVANGIDVRDESPDKVYAHEAVVALRGIRRPNGKTVLVLARVIRTGNEYVVSNALTTIDSFGAAGDPALPAMLARLESEARPWLREELQKSIDRIRAQRDGGGAATGTRGNRGRKAQERHGPSRGDSAAQSV